MEAKKSNHPPLKTNDLVMITYGSKAHSRCGIPEKDASIEVSRKPARMINLTLLSQPGIRIPHLHFLRKRAPFNMSMHPPKGHTQ